MAALSPKADIELDLVQRAANDPNLTLRILEPITYIDLGKGISMKQYRWKELFDVVGVIAIVGSLLFVGYQLQQDHLIAKSALTSQAFDTAMEVNLRVSDAEFGRIFAKVLDEPHELTTEETVKVDAFLNAVKDLWIRECFLMHSGMYDECDGIIREYSSRYFSNSFAQSWWTLNKLPSDGSVFSVPVWVDHEIASLDTQSKKQMFEEVKANIQ